MNYVVRLEDSKRGNASQRGNREIQMVGEIEHNGINVLVGQEHLKSTSMKCDKRLRVVIQFP